MRSGEQSDELFWIVRAAPPDVKCELDRFQVDLDVIVANQDGACRNPWTGKEPGVEARRRLSDNGDRCISGRRDREVM